jgi:hypothetical protein
MRLVFGVAVLSAGMVTMLGGCEPNQLFLGSRTVVGVNAAVDSTQANGWLVVGYDRTFAAVVPRSIDDVNKAGVKTGKQDAMSALVCSRLEVKGITIKHFKESIATGDAARTFAENLKDSDPAPVKDFFNCFKNKPETKPSGT